MSKFSSLMRAVGASRVDLMVKQAGAEELLRIAPMMADDVMMLALRRFAGTTNQALAVPAGVEKIRTINDPNYQPDPRLRGVRLALNATSKMASPILLPRAPEAEAKWELDKNRIGAAFNMVGPAQQNTIASEGNVSAPDFPKQGNLMAAVRRIATGQPVTGSLTSTDASRKAFQSTDAVGSIDQNHSADGAAEAASVNVP